MLAIYKIKNHSMSPSIMEGDFVLVLRICNKWFTREGKVVLFKHPVYGTMIKKIEKNNPKSLYVVSTNNQGVNSSVFGEVPRKQVIGRVLWVFSKDRSIDSMPQPLEG